ncbi:MAG: amino acid synthesis family protein [Gammaproteobacteria bacterium]|nr:amino acid synthesis family protein [Gammaproteobacteria bacterium]
MNIRKTVVIQEVVHGEGGSSCTTPVTRIAGIGIIENPFAGQFVDDLSDLFALGEELGQSLMEKMLPQLSNPVVSYGKAAIVGIGGDLEHGHAMIHPKLGKAMRDPIGGGQALIPSTAKVAVAGTYIDIPLGHKDDAWSFDHFDAMTVNVADAPRATEIMMAIAICDGGRPVPRVGKERAAV